MTESWIREGKERGKEMEIEIEKKTRNQGKGRKRV